jgi:putative transposase
MLAGLSSRRYTAGLEPPGQVVDGAAAATSRSAVSRRFVAATETALAELMARRLDDLDLVAFMVDRVHFGEYTCVVALGIGIDPATPPLKPALRLPTVARLAARALLATAGTSALMATMWWKHHHR